MLALILLCAIAFGSLIFVSFINRRQEKEQKKNIRIRELKMQVSDIEELCTIIDGIVESPIIAKLINDQSIQLLEKMQDIDDSLTYVEASLDVAKQRSADLDNPERERHVNRVMSSDAQVARSQHKLNEAARILRAQATDAHFSYAELEIFIQELNWQHLLIEVLTFIGQGHSAIQKSDLLTAQAFYKKAQQQLIQSQNSDPRRKELIKQLGDILINKRHVISTDIMPETHLNPTNVEELRGKLTNDDTETATDESNSETATGESNSEQGKKSDKEEDQTTTSDPA